MPKITFLMACINMYKPYCSHGRLIALALPDYPISSNFVVQPLLVIRQQYAAHKEPSQTFELSLPNGVVKQPPKLSAKRCHAMFRGHENQIPGRFFAY